MKEEIKRRWRTNYMLEIKVMVFTGDMAVAIMAMIYGLLRFHRVIRGVHKTMYLCLNKYCDIPYILPFLKFYIYIYIYKDKN